MAELTASCWTIDMLPTNASASIIHPDIHGFILGKIRQTRVRASLNNAATDLVYPAGGIPLPTFNATTPAGEPSYGMRRNLSYLIPYGEQFTSVSRAQDVLWKYAPSSNAMRGFQARYEEATTFSANRVAVVTEMVELPTTWTPTQGTDTPSFEFVAIGW